MLASEMDLAENFEKILYSSMNDVNAIETTEKETLDSQEQFKNYEVQAIENDTVFKEEKDYDVCSYDEELSFDYCCEFEEVDECRSVGVNEKDGDALAAFATSHSRGPPRTN